MKEGQREKKKESKKTNIQGGGVTKQRQQRVLVRKNLVLNRQPF
jgi:hypothetical protein